MLRQVDPAVPSDACLCMAVLVRKVNNHPHLARLSSVMWTLRPLILPLHVLYTYLRHTFSMHHHSTPSPRQHAPIQKHIIDNHTDETYSTLPLY